MAAQAKQRGTLPAPAGSLGPHMLFIFSIIFTTWEHPQFFTWVESIWHLDYIQEIEASGLALIGGMGSSTDNSEHQKQWTALSI